jgi:methionyl-tRNA formyltransferase
LVSDSTRLSSQDETDATYCGQRSEADGAINWAQDAKSVHDFIRAQAPPYPCAFTYLGQKQIRVLRSQIFNGTYFGTPGQVLRRNKQSVLVSCGNNTAIELLNVRVGNSIVEEMPVQVIKSITGRLTDKPVLSDPYLPD